MQQFIETLSSKLTPAMTKITNNLYIQSLQAAIMQALPMIFVSSIVTIITSVLSFFPDFMAIDLSPLSTFSFGLFSVFIAFLIPYNILEKKRMSKNKTIAGLTSICMFFMFVLIDFSTDPAGITFSRLGSEGMLCAMISGIFVGVIMSLFHKFSFFKKDSVIPDFVKSWFNNSVPIFIILFVGYILIYILHLDIFALIVKLFNPLTQIGQTMLGFVIMNVVCVLFYSFGISPWVLTPIIYTIMLTGIADNADLVARGLAPTAINTQETVYFGWLALGGLGTTLPLNIMMLFSKAKSVKTIGKATIVPSIMNINEPIVYGAPIVFNPILMIPFWAVSIVLPIIVYLALANGFAPIPSQVFYVMGLPLGVTTWIVSPAITSLILLAVVYAVAHVIWYPFFKIYEKQELLKEECEVHENK